MANNWWRKGAPRSRLNASILALLAAVVTTALFLSPSSAQSQDADTILVRGKIVTLDDHSSVVEAVAIRHRLVIATGSSADVLKRAGAGTRVVDLGGRTVIPGLIDSHIHAIRAGLKFSVEVSWIGATSIAEAMERLRVAAIYAAPGSWIVVGGGWTPSQFSEGRQPTQAELIAAAPDRPVYVQLFYRAALLTPLGLKALGFDGETDLPANAKFDRGDDGQLNGWIIGDSAAITGLYAKLPSAAPGESMEGTRRFFARAQSVRDHGRLRPRRP